VHYVDVEPVPVAPGVQRRTLAWGERTMVMETTFDSGAELAMHAHPHEQVTYLVSGALELRVGGQPFTLSAGDSILVPGGAAHGGVARVRSVAIDAFSPPREDLK
jgi:quercetin dioxygenase-like cupin family protein